LKSELEFPRGTEIIVCNEITFAGKDIVSVKFFKDFLFLLGNGATIFNLSNKYYLVSDAVAYIYEDKGGGKIR